MKFLTAIDRIVFSVSVAAGVMGALAGGFGWTYTAVAAGCVAAAAPIVNRLVAARLHDKLLADMGPRSLSVDQRQRLVARLREGSPFQLWVAHNRHEGEPASFHGQIFGAFKEAGLDPQWFGGMNNSTVGIEISGDLTAEKALLMDAFKAADIPFLPIHFNGPEADQWKLAVWIGSNPGPLR